MRKTHFLGFVVSGTLLLSSCGQAGVSNETKSTAGESSGSLCPSSFVIEWPGSSPLSLKAKVLSDNVRNVVANNGGNVESLDCEKGKKVSATTLIAKINPDLSDPNVKNLMNQRDAFGSQLSNTRDILASTKANFSTQLGSLSVQKANLENQIRLLNDNLAKIQEQRKFGVSDIDKQLELLQIQLETLDTQTLDLKNSKTKLEDSKKADLSKLGSNLQNARTQAKTLVSNVLVQVDETFGISEKNREKNDAYDTYLSAKNSGLKDSVIASWGIANRDFVLLDTESDEDASLYLQSVGDLIAKAKDSVKNSVPSSNFSQATIDGLFAVFVQYESNLLTAKNGLDTVSKSLDTVKNTYDTQILALDTQINASENSKKGVSANVDNLRSNKLGSYTSSLDLQANQAESQIETSRTGLSGIESQIESLKSQEEIQLNQLNNQLSQLQSSINAVGINLTPQAIYAGTDGIIKEKSATVGNKVAANGLLCQILPSRSSLKLQAYSSYDLPLPVRMEFEADGKKYSTELKTKLPYQDPATQNSLYEAASSLTLDGKPVDIAAVLSEGRVLDVSVIPEGKPLSHSKISVPIDFVSNTIGGFRVKVKASDGKVTEKEVVLGSLDSDTVEVKSGLSLGDTLCR